MRYKNTTGCGGGFPNTRLRRNRSIQFIRDLVQENYISIKDLVYPVFIVDGHARTEEIKSLPGQKRVSIDNLMHIAEECQELGVPAIALFPMIEIEKSKNLASVMESHNPDGLVPSAIKSLKKNYPELGVFTDIALDAYTYDGHDGISDENGKVLNDLTNEYLVKQALCHAEAGADFVCPSDMMDGRVGKIRNGLDSAGFDYTGIIAYAAKYASQFYGPFREATGALSNLGRARKTTYQMNPANSNEAVLEAFLDVLEGADILMVKPGLPYLDILYRFKTEFNTPVSVYHVSGEYAMLKSAHQFGWLDYESAMLEVMLCFKRAGADFIWTYGALDVARYLRQLY